MTEKLTSAQCILLTVQYASEANIRALHAFTPSRLDVLSPELVLRIVLSYLPETTDPALYTTYVREVATRIYLEQQEPYTPDPAPVASLSPKQAQKQVDKLRIAELSPPAFPPHAPDDLLTRFVIHRAIRIDSETGVLSLAARLAEAFFDNNDFLRTWYISLVLPLVRLRYDYYPKAKDSPTLDEFEKLDGAQGIDVLLSHTTDVDHQVTSPTDSEGVAARDIRAMVGPWMYGHTERKRRRLNAKHKTTDENKPPANSPPRTGFIKLDGVSAEDKTGHDWEYVFEWMVQHAVHEFPLVTNLVEEWDGPGDVDLGGFHDPQTYLDDDTQAKLERQYAQAAFASCYAVEADTSEAIDGAHGILVRLAQLLDFEPPPELATSVKQLPVVDKHAELLHASESTVLLDPDVLLRPEHPLATPKLETYMLLQMMVYSAYQLAGLGHSISVLHVAKLRFFSDADEQLALLLKILHGLAAHGKRDDQQWQYDYDRLIWLWNWNIELEDGGRKGAGIFGKIEKTTIERELLKVLVSSGCKSADDDLASDIDRILHITDD